MGHSPQLSVSRKSIEQQNTPHIHDLFNLLVLCSHFSLFSSGTWGGGIRKFSYFTTSDKATASEADQLQEIFKVGETSSLCNIFYYFLFLLSTGESLTSRYSRNTDQRLHTSFSSGEFARLKPKDMSSPLVSDHSDNGRRVISPIRRRSDDDVCISANSSPGFFCVRNVGGGVVSYSKGAYIATTTKV